MKKISRCSLWILGLMAINAIAQTPPDCYENPWDEVTGQITYDPHGEECGYEIETWGVPSFLGVDMEDILQTAQGTRIFSYRMYLNELDLSHAAKFMSLEWVVANEIPVLQIGLSWGPSLAPGETLVQSEARVFPLRRQSVPASGALIGTFETDSSVLSLDMQVLWQPSTHGLANGSIEFRVNGQFAGKIENLDLGVLGPRTIGSVRYGYVRVSQQQPVGTLRIVPHQPTPDHPHL